MNIVDLQKQSQKAAELLKMMSNEKRLLILCHLGESELSVNALVDIIGLSQSALSQHLAVLRTQNLVSTRRQAQTIFYSIKDPAVNKILNTLYQLYCPKQSGTINRSPNYEH